MKRIWHPWTAWECYRAGFYNPSPPEGLTADEARIMYRDFLHDTMRFWAAMARVAAEWPTSCEHFLTNTDINRIAWLGQSAMCIETGVSCVFRGGFKLLTPAEQRRANATAARFLTQWERDHAQQDHQLHRDVEDSRIPGRHSRRGAAAAHESGTGSVVQGNLFRNPPQRPFDGVAGVHAARIEMVRYAEAIRDRGTSTEAGRPDALPVVTP